MNAKKEKRKLEFNICLKTDKEIKYYWFASEPAYSSRYWLIYESEY